MFMTAHRLSAIVSINGHVHVHRVLLFFKPTNSCRSKSADVMNLYSRMLMINVISPKRDMKGAAAAGVVDP